MCPDFFFSLFRVRMLYECYSAHTISQSIDRFLDSPTVDGASSFTSSAHRVSAVGRALRDARGDKPSGVWNEMADRTALVSLMDGLVMKSTLWSASLTSVSESATKTSSDGDHGRIDDAATLPIVDPVPVRPALLHRGYVAGASKG